jgi:hypothetical protein
MCLSWAVPVYRFSGLRKRSGTGLPVLRKRSGTGLSPWTRQARVSVDKIAPTFVDKGGTHAQIPPHGSTSMALSKAHNANDCQACDDDTPCINFRMKPRPGQQYCKNWKFYGTCEFGDECRYAHAWVEGMRCAPARRQVFNAPCRFWWNRFSCRFGKDCSFRHNELTPEGKQLASHEICERWLVGMCDGTNGCEYHHGRYETLPTDPIEAKVFLSYIPAHFEVSDVQQLVQSGGYMRTGVYIQLNKSKIATFQKTAYITFHDSITAYAFIDFMLEHEKENKPEDKIRAQYSSTSLLVSAYDEDEEPAYDDIVESQTQSNADSDPESDPDFDPVSDTDSDTDSELKMASPPEEVHSLMKTNLLYTLSPRVDPLNTNVLIAPIPNIFRGASPVPSMTVQDLQRVFSELENVLANPEKLKNCMQYMAVEHPLYSFGRLALDLCYEESES